MTLMQLTLILSLIGLTIDGYFIWEHFQNRKSRSNYQKELDKYFHVMGSYGFSHEEIINMLFDIKSFEDLKEHNKKAKKHLTR